MTMFICDVNVFLIITLYMIHGAELNLQETAMCQTVRAASDLICRVVATFVLNKYNVPARYCFLVSQVFAAFLRLGKYDLCYDNLINHKLTHCDFKTYSNLPTEMLIFLFDIMFVKK